MYCPQWENAVQFSTAVKRKASLRSIVPGGWEVFEKVVAYTLGIADVAATPQRKHYDDTTATRYDMTQGLTCAWLCCLFIE